MTRTVLSFHALVCICFLISCDSAPTTPQSAYQTSNADGSSLVAADIMDTSTWDFGEITMDDDNSIFQAAQPSEPQFAIVIATFTGSGHESVAESTRSQLGMQIPALAQNMSVRQRSRGSVLTFGDYQGYDDEMAQRDIKMLRSLRAPQGGQLFAQILLMKFKPPLMRRELHPYDLWTIRREFPTVVPIFTLEVAVWGDFDSGEFPRDRRRSSAEGYATELRKKGFEAFFYHNDEAELSSVTIGLFGHTAVDAETGFYSPEVEAMLSRFPSRLVNGEEVRAYFNPAKPELGSNIQPPCLAEVPVD